MHFYFAASSPPIIMRRCLPIISHPAFATVGFNIVEALPTILNSIYWKHNYLERKRVDKRESYYNGHANLLFDSVLMTSSKNINLPYAKVELIKS